MWRHVLSIALAGAWIVSAAAALADDAGSLNLPTAISPESLAKTSAKGEATAAADASVEDGNLHASASATASIDQPITINGPVTTGSIGDLGRGGTSQISTGIGNIQQGVQATAFSF
jgi:hypothetical protein